jgi:hypothetical protein
MLAYNSLNILNGNYTEFSKSSLKLKSKRDTIRNNIIFVRHLSYILNFPYYVSNSESSACGNKRLIKIKTIKRFAGSDKLPKLVESATNIAKSSSAAASAHNIDGCNNVEPKSSTQYLRESRTNNNTDNQESNINRSNENSINDNKPMVTDIPEDLKINSIKEKVEELNVLARKNYMSQASLINQEETSVEFEENSDEFKETQLIIEGGAINSATTIINNSIPSEPKTDPHAAILVYDPSNQEVRKIAALTSDKHGTPDGKINNFRLSSEKFDGSSTPQIKKTKSCGMDDYNNLLPKKSFPGEPVNDDFGNFIPDPNKGGQYLRIHKNQQRVLHETFQDLNFEKDDLVTEYVNNPNIKNQIISIYEENKDNPTQILLPVSLSEEIFSNNIEINKNKDNSTLNENNYQNEVVNTYADEVD